MAAINNSLDDDLRTYEELELVIGKLLIPSLCIVGVIGNVLNISILTRHHLKSRMDSLEKSSYIGLIALAISDLMYCLTIPYRKFIPKIFSSKDLPFYYMLYGDVLTSTFVMSSTWLTVVMAVARYFAVSRPFRARRILNVRCMLFSIILVFIISTIFNVPKRWEQTSFSVTDSDNQTHYFIFPGPLEVHANEKLLLFGNVYRILRAVCGNFIPLLILIMCNVGLMRNLRRAQEQRESLSAHRGNHQQDKHDESVRQDSKRLTLTLVIIIIMFFILVAPHEIVMFILRRTNETKSEVEFFIPDEILRLCLVVNFSTNFVLYCAVNRIFRNVLQSWIKFCTPRCFHDAHAHRGCFISPSPNNNNGIPMSELPGIDGIVTEIQALDPDSRKQSLV